MGPRARAGESEGETSARETEASSTAPSSSPARRIAAITPTTTTTTTTTQCGGDRDYSDVQVQDANATSTSVAGGRNFLASLLALAFTLMSLSRLTSGGRGEEECRYEGGGGGDNRSSNKEDLGISPSLDDVRIAGYSVLATFTVLMWALDGCGGGGGAPRGSRRAGSLWRTASFGWMLSYALLMVFILHMPDAVAARGVLSTFFPDVGDLDEYQRLLRIKIDTVMGSCVFSSSTLFRQLFLCPWFLCHLVGYAWKMAIFRDWRVAFMAGVAFELWEVTLMYFVPEFEECWWDALFLDVLGGNLIGIIAGHHLNGWMFGEKGKDRVSSPPSAQILHTENGGASAADRNGSSSSPPGIRGEDFVSGRSSPRPATLAVNGSSWRTNPLSSTRPATVESRRAIEDLPRFNWLGEGERTTPSSQILSLASPLSSAHQYEILRSPARLARVGAMILLMLVLETNQFLINNALGVPNGSAFCAMRLVLIGLVGVPAGAEWYGYVEACATCKDGGRRTTGGLRSCLLLCFMAMVELSVVLKFFPPHMSVEIERTGGRFGIPHGVAIPHLISFGAVSSWLLLRYGVVGYTSFRAPPRRGGEEEEGALLEMLESSSSGDDARWWRNFRMLPPEYKRQVLAKETPDLLLVLASIPFVYLFLIGWKWD